MYHNFASESVYSEEWYASCPALTRIISLLVEDVKGEGNFGQMTEYACWHSLAQPNMPGPSPHLNLQGPHYKPSLNCASCFDPFLLRTQAGYTTKIDSTVCKGKLADAYKTATLQKQVILQQSVLKLSKLFKEDKSHGVDRYGPNRSHFQTAPSSLMSPGSTQVCSMS